MSCRCNTAHWRARSKAGSVPRSLIKRRLSTPPLHRRSRARLEGAGPEVLLPVVHVLGAPVQLALGVAAVAGFLSLANDLLVASPSTCWAGLSFDTRHGGRSAWLKRRNTQTSVGRPDQRRQNQEGGTHHCKGDGWQRAHDW